MKKILPLIVLLSAGSLHADVYVGSSSSGTFRGQITAIETDRNSITVQSAENTVKMFRIPASRIKRLQPGQTVTVSYIDGETWPLAIRSIR